MLNYLWGILIIIGVVYASFTGRMPEVTNGAIDSSKEAVTLCITMLGVMSLWTGLMQIAKNAGIIDACTRKIRPIMKWLFPEVPENHEAMEHMTTNMIANFLGLGWAATPAGIKAMQSLAKLQEQNCKRSGTSPAIASNAMCTFLVINISSLQLIPVNIIAYRSQYGSVNPAAIVGPAILATFVSTAVGILCCRIFGRRNQ